METALSSSGVHDVVAIGASAGGVLALQTLLAELPADLEAAVLVVQHLEPSRVSVLPQILGRHAHMPVHAAVHGELIAPGSVYICVPNIHLLANGDHIALEASPLVHFSRPSVDSLFASVATAYGARAIAVVLTGSGSDGTQGVKAVKQHGGVTIVQDVREAPYPSMPASAYATRCVDLMLPLAEIATTIVRLVGKGAARVVH